MSDPKMMGNPWISLARAATHLDETPIGLRKKLDRAATKTDSGAIVAKFDDLEARKFRKLWKVRLGKEWQ